MVLPIVAYGDVVLRKVGKEISKDYPKLNELIENMFETMYKAMGVGLAAPQIGLPIRLFVVDTAPFVDEEMPLLRHRLGKAQTMHLWDFETHPKNSTPNPSPDKKGNLKLKKRVGL